MKRKSCFLILCIICSSAIGWELPEVGDYKFESIGANVSVMHGPLGEPNVLNQGFMNNPGLIESKNGVKVLFGPSNGISKTRERPWRVSPDNLGSARVPYLLWTEAFSQWYPSSTAQFESAAPGTTCRKTRLPSYRN